MRKILGLSLLVGVLAVVGCTASADVPPSTSPAPSATPSSQTPLAVPTSEPDQLAIASFDNTGTVSLGDSVSGPAVLDGNFRIEADCRGESFTFRLRDATVGAPERDIAGGEIDCSSPVVNTYEGLDVTGGPVQMVIVDSNNATEGWARAVLTD